jgi:hypothetical protein
MAINCCYGCVPPKRTPTCKFDGTCNKYAAAKKKHDEEKMEIERKSSIERALNDHYAKVSYRVKKARHKKG